MSILALTLLGAGLFLMGVTALGMLRLPDFYSRVHAVSKTETLGIALVLLALIAHNGASLLSLKFGLIMLFVGIANPVGAHVLTRAAARTGLLPWRRPGPAGRGTADG